jgi:hypothetical protein
MSDRLDLSERYRADEIAEFVVVHYNAANEQEVREALAAWTEHMREGGFAVGDADHPRGAVAPRPIAEWEHWLCPRCESVDGPLSGYRCEVCAAESAESEVVELARVNTPRGAV